MAKGCCSNCTHYQHDSGECWGRPPLAQMGMRMNPLTRQPEEIKITYFPCPNKDWITKICCGAYAPRLGVAQ